MTGSYCLSGTILTDGMKMFVDDGGVVVVIQQYTCA